MTTADHSQTSWPEVPLGQLLSAIETGKNLRCEERPPEPHEKGVVKVSSVTRGFFDKTQSKTLPSDYEPNPRSLIRSGDFLFSRANGSQEFVGACAIVVGAPDNLYLSDKVLRLVLPTEIKLWLLSFLRSRIGRARIEAASTGIDMRNISQEAIRGLMVPLPPHASERRRIATKIDSLSSKSRRVRDHLDHIPRLVEKYKQAILAAEFSLISGKCGSMPLADVLVSTFYGPRFGKDAYTEQGVVTLRTTDFDAEGNIRPRSPPTVRVSDSEYAKWGLLDGDLLVTRTGSIGKCALYQDVIGPALPSAYLIRVRLQRNCVMPRYVLLFLLSGMGQKQLMSGVTAVTQPNINAGVIERVRLPVPDLDRQEVAIHRIGTAFAWIDRLAAEATSARKLIDHLNEAVLAKAFRGELVPRDPADEPASALLDHIRSERENDPRRRRRSATA